MPVTTEGEMMDSSERDNAAPPFSGGRLIALIAVTLMIAGAAYWQATSPYRTAQKPPLYELGMDQPTENSLDDRYADANGDLVADPPADAADWIDPPEIRFGYLAAEQARYEELWTPMLAKLSEACGRPVTFVPHESPDDELAGIRSGDLHLVGINAGSVPVAVNECGFVPLVSFGREGELASYTMRILARADSNIRKVADLRGRMLALTHPTSNSGWKAPLLLLRDRFELQPVVDYDIVSTGDHALSIEALANGDHEAVAVASDELRRAEIKGVIEPEDYRVIYESDAFCNNTFGCPHNLHPELAAQLKQAMLDLEWEPAFADAFSQIGASAFVAVAFKSDFGTLREIDDAMGVRAREMLSRKF